MKTRVVLILAICFSLFNFVVLAQNGYEDKVNRYNHNEQKEGLWKENTSKYWRTETYYQNGKKNGIYKKFSTRRNELELFGEYRNDTITGTWYHFGDYGHLMMTFSEFTKNIHSIITGNNKGKYTPDYKCYMTSYYPNGRKKEEGLLLWNEGESPESDFSVEYGEWKYYDENGNLIEVKVFK